MSDGTAASGVPAGGISGTADGATAAPRFTMRASSGVVVMAGAVVLALLWLGPEMGRSRPLEVFDVRLWRFALALFAMGMGLGAATFLRPVRFEIGAAEVTVRTWFRRHRVPYGRMTRVYIDHQGRWPLKTPVIVWGPLPRWHRYPIFGPIHLGGAPVAPEAFAEAVERARLQAVLA